MKAREKCERGASGASEQASEKAHEKRRINSCSQQAEKQALHASTNEMAIGAARAPLALQ